MQPVAPQWLWSFPLIVKIFASDWRGNDKWLKKASLSEGRNLSKFYSLSLLRFHLGSPTFGVSEAKEATDAEAKDWRGNNDNKCDGPDDNYKERFTMWRFKSQEVLNNS